MTEYEKTLESYIEATNTHNFDNVEKYLSVDAVYFFTDKKCSSMDEIRSYFEKSWEIITDEKYEARNVQWIVATEKVAICVYDYKYQGKMNGKEVVGGGKATNIFVIEGSKWKLVHEHLSS